MLDLAGQVWGVGPFGQTLPKLVVALGQCR